MAARKIPIAGQRPAPSTAPPTAWASSLDLVFSFSRSAAFFGENLPTGPSFVDSQRYRRPGGFPDDGESSIAPSDREREASEDRDESVATTDDEAWSGDELDGGVIQSWENDGPPVREQLPSNAVAHHARRPRRSRGSARPATQSESPAPSEPPYSAPSTHSSSHLLPPSSSSPNERSPLISRPTSSSADRTPLLLRAANLADHTKQHHTSPEHFANRRLSIISSEVWQAAVEENRGKSTYGQTLFNT